MAYQWTKKNYKLTKEQKERGVVFSSQFMNHTTKEVGMVHEVYADQKDRQEAIKRLKNVCFFKHMAKDYGYRCEVIERS